MQEKETVEFELKELLPYSKGGNKTETACVIMRAPRMSEFNESTAFSQIVTQAFMDAQKWAPDKGKEKQKKDQGMEAGAVRVMLFASDRNINEVSRKFKALANRVCTIDEDGTPLKDSLMDKMEIEDFITMMCEYVSIFIYPSLFNAMEDKEGETLQKESGAPSEAT